MDSVSRSKEEQLNKNLAFNLVRAFLGIVGMVLTSLCDKASWLSVGVKC